MAVSSEQKLNLGEKLKKARTACGLSQRKTAQAIGKTNAALSDIENGFNFPSEELLLALIKHLTPPPELRNEIFKIYAEAKDAPPPDISTFVKENPCLQELLREMMVKELTGEGIKALRNQIKHLEDKKNEPTE